MIRTVLCRCVCAAVLASSLAGCAVVSVQTASKEDVEVTRGFGIVSLQVKPGAATVLVDSTTLGAISAVDGIAVGFHRANFAAIAGDRCQLVLWIKTRDQMDELDSLLRGRKDVCVLGPE
jgi:hypothetical protein